MSRCSDDVRNHLLVHDDTDRIVQQTLTKDDSIKFRVNLVLIKDGQDGDRVSCGERGTKYQAFKKGDFQ